MRQKTLPLLFHTHTHTKKVSGQKTAISDLFLLRICVQSLNLEQNPANMFYNGKYKKNIKILYQIRDITRISQRSSVGMR